MLKNTVFVFFLFVLSTGLAIAGESGARDKVPDHGRQPWVVDIEDLTENNDNFRTTMWTGMNL
ncbi:MAG: cupin domain-containing protein, partial [Smithellaceae bacterium]